MNVMLQDAIATVEREKSIFNYISSLFAVGGTYKKKPSSTVQDDKKSLKKVVMNSQTGRNHSKENGDISSEQSERTSVTSRSSKNFDQDGDHDRDPDADDDEGGGPGHRSPQLQHNFDNTSVFSNFSNECDNALRYRRMHRWPGIDRRQRRLGSLLSTPRKSHYNYFVEMDSSRAESVYTPDAESRAESESVSEHGAAATRDVSDNEGEDIDYMEDQEEELELELPGSSLELEFFPEFPEDKALGRFSSEFSLNVSLPMPRFNFGPLSKDESNEVEEEVTEMLDETDRQASIGDEKTRTAKDPTNGKRLTDITNPNASSASLSSLTCASSIPTTDTATVWTRKNAYPHDVIKNSRRRSAADPQSSPSLFSDSEGSDTMTGMQYSASSLTILRPSVPIPFHKNGVLLSVSEVPTRIDGDGALLFLPKVLGRSVTLYTITVKLLKPGIPGYQNEIPCTFAVQRRYKEFRQFYSNLVKLYANVVAEWPSFPKGPFSVALTQPPLPNASPHSPPSWPLSPYILSSSTLPQCFAFLVSILKLASIFLFLPLKVWEVSCCMRERGDCRMRGGGIGFLEVFRCDV
ncbi:hypothetical protein BC829DRAFT_32124 [Chytridium lagenaria]|nr:hypothetical protein BC829DRAFT_32124 [Chytridium lagenaria]